ncbi:MAG: polyhydroxyalkanoate synthesis regulator DNA-binding domain-containing protein [Planctomycetota bacterium]
MILIKRYSNRKLYNTNTKKYITLEGIAELVKKGEEIRVVHNDTDEDLTTLTLSQVLYEGEKKRSSSLPKSIFTNIIQNNVVVDRFKKTMNIFAEMVSPNDFKDDVDHLITQGQISEREGIELKEMLFSLWHRNLDRVNHIIDNRIQAIFNTFNVPTKADLDRIESLILQLDKKVDHLLTHQAKMETDFRIKLQKTSEPVSSELNPLYYSREGSIEKV